MRGEVRTAVLVFWTAFICPAMCIAQDSGLTLELHPWGRFKPGAWKSYRVVSETFDERGVVVDTSITLNKTTLESAEARKGVTLLVEAMVEMAGRQLASEPRTIRQGLHGDIPVEKATVRDLGTAALTIDGRTISCHVEEQESVSQGTRTVNKVFFTPSVAPFVLRRETRTIDAEQDSVISETVLNVTSFNAACNFLPRVRNAAQVMVVSTHPKGKTVTKATTSTEVPGGILFHTAEEWNADGLLVRRSTLTLLEFGTEPRREHSGVFGRIRTRGHRAHRLNQPDDSARPD